MKARGVSGQLRTGGRIAASLGPWTLTQDALQWVVESTPRSVDAYWIDSTGPFELRLDVGSSVWKWRNVTVSGRERLTITATGPREKG